MDFFDEAFFDEDFLDEEWLDELPRLVALFFDPERPEELPPEARAVVRFAEPRPELVPVRPVLFAEPPRAEMDLEEDFFAADLEPEDFEPADFEPEEREPDDFEPEDLELDLEPDPELDLDVDFDADFEPEPRALEEREDDLPRVEAPRDFEDPDDFAFSG